VLIFKASFSFASKGYMEAYMEAHRAFRHAQTEEEHDKAQ
jgi:hypothetical protein